MATKIQLRGDTLVNWTSVNPILSEREIVIETDSNKIKIGDGVHHYLDLSYASSDGGRSINSISRTSGTGLAGSTDVYTITYTDETTSTFTVVNGTDGVDGQGGSSLKDNKYVSMGDSITFGYGSSRGYPELLDDTVQFTSHLNIAESGCTCMPITDRVQLYSQIQNIPIDTTLLTIMIGVNDFIVRNVIGSVYDVLNKSYSELNRSNSFSEAFRYNLETIKKLIPNIRIIVLTPVCSAYATPDIFREYIDAEIAICNFLSIQVFNVYDNSRILANDVNLSGGLHPTDIGQGLIKNFILESFLNDSDNSSPLPKELETLNFILSGYDNPITTGVKYVDTFVNGFILKEIVLCAGIARLDGSITVDILKNRSSIFLTPIVLDENQITSYTSLVKYILSVQNIFFCKGDRLTIEVKTVNGTTGGNGVSIKIVGCKFYTENINPLIFDNSLSRQILSDGNTELWYDFTDTKMVIKDSQNRVYTVLDKSGNSRLLSQPDQAKQPLCYGVGNGVLFDGIDDMMITQNFGLKNPEEIYVVFAPHRNTGYNFMIDSLGTGTLVIAICGAYYTQSNGNIFYATNSDFQNGTFLIGRFRFAGADSSAQINELTKATGNIGANNVGGISVGCPNNSPNLAANCTIKELIVRKILDTPEDDLAIYNYLKTKHNIV